MKPRSTNRFSRDLGELAPLFLTQQELEQYYSILLHDVLTDQVNRALDILFGVEDRGATPGSFLQGFLVRVYNSILDAFLLCPVYDVRPDDSEHGLVVMFRMEQRSGEVLEFGVPLEDVWPVAPEHQDQARSQRNKTLVDE
ncbi:hypothetical protein GPECTOR_1772g865 [Gonium pectorale]|uniref:Uncharacterized protein n=1 Tax=Gonium pectorale TaxID=33097 RepID=A0A150FTA7_GONPE|nr:hypothetical protein GPECTOR_1772g865 [Gonium pectorale]|eukprot:KXZ40857.1 hypothetical protein GPECTOR_1772g865 [Gonium pectorale]